MNRIYQGRITRAETLTYKDGNGKLQEFSTWRLIARHHHELFSERGEFRNQGIAVNYLYQDMVTTPEIRDGKKDHDKLMLRIWELRGLI